MFPYPEKPEDWQTAYTRDQAYRDSNKYGGNLWLPIILCFLIALVFMSIRMARFPFFETFAPIVRAGIIFVIILLSLAFFVIIVTVPSMRFASSFFTKFYCPPKGVDPSKIIKYRLSGKSKMPPPLNLLVQFKYIIARDGDLDKKDQWPVWSALNLGGPIMLIVFDGNALYLERGNRFSRVVGPGEKVPFLEWYETIKYVVDLRPQRKTGNIEVWTKDGIRISLDIQIECRIGNPAKNDPTAGLVYPYDPIAIKKAVERYAVRWPKRLEKGPEEFTWLDAAWGQATGIVPGYIGKRMLDDLFMASRNNGQILSPNAIKEIFNDINHAMNVFGVFLTDFQILKIELPKEVNDHQRGHWMAERQSIATIRDGRAKAFNIRSQEKARADAQRDLILAIADGLDKNDDGRYAEPLLMSLSEILDSSMQDPLMRAYLANETLDTLEKIKAMLGKSS